MKIVFEMNDDDFRNIDFLLQSHDSTKAYFFDEIMKNCVPLFQVLDNIDLSVELQCVLCKIRSEIIGKASGLEEALEIIEQYIAEGGEK